MPATRTYVRNFLLSQAHRWAWRDPVAFQRLIDEDDSVLNKAVTLWRLVPDDRDPEDTCSRINWVYQSLTDGNKTLEDLCKQFGWLGNFEKQRAHRALGILVLANLVKYEESSRSYSPVAEKPGKTILDPDQKALEFYINTYRNDCLGRHVCG